MTPSFTQLSNRQKGMGGECRHNVNLLCCKGQARNIDFTFMCGMHDGAIGIANDKRMGSHNLVVNWRTGGEKMGSATGVSNGTTEQR